MRQQGVHNRPHAINNLESDCRRKIQFMYLIFKELQHRTSITIRCFCKDSPSPMRTNKQDIDSSKAKKISTCACCNTLIYLQTL